MQTRLLILIVVGILVIVAIVIGLAITILNDDNVSAKSVIACNDDNDKFLCLANAFDACNKAKLHHEMQSEIRNEVIDVYVYITHDCKLDVTQTTRTGTDPVKRESFYTYCNNIRLQDRYVDLSNCNSEDNDVDSVRVWTKDGLSEK